METGREDNSPAERLSGREETEGSFLTGELKNRLDTEKSREKGLVGFHASSALRDFRVINKGGTAMTVALCNYFLKDGYGGAFCLQKIPKQSPITAKRRNYEQRTCKNL